MKNIYILILFFAMNVNAQSVRTSLYEDFTSETCPPDATINPGLKIMLDSFASKVVSIRWHIPIPAAPTLTWSPYQANKIENNWRYQGTGTGYGYSGQFTPTGAPANGINTSPTGVIDGQHQWSYGTLSDNPSTLTYTALNNAQAVMSPFDIVMTRTWNPSFTSVAVTISITATQNFTAVGALIYRLVMVEQEIHFLTPPGSNGEKDFYNTARASFPNIQNGTALPGTWTIGQNQTFTLNCNLPSTILDKSQVNFVGFIQDDGNRKVMQAAATTTVGLADDASLKNISGTLYTCANTYSPITVLKNNGVNTITNMTITPSVDGIAGAPFFYAGNLLAGASVTLAAPMVTAASGTHTYMADITGVNTGIDYNPGNNSKQTNFVIVTSYSPAPLTESFTGAVFPPVNWWMSNFDLGLYTWSRNAAAGGFGVGCCTAKYEFFNNTVKGDVDDLFLSPMDLSGVSNPMLTFDVAYARYDPSYNDSLAVLVSTNCGSSWTQVYIKGGGPVGGINLATAPDITTSFFPSATQWRTEVINLNAFANQAQVLIKFSAKNQYGNNLYIDNVNLTNATGIKTKEEIFSRLDLYPNPANTFANVEFELSQNEDLMIMVTNNIGQIVYTQAAKNFEAGSHVIKLNTENWSSGIYSVNLKTSEVSTTKKLIISK